jgi:hypothetical protein
LNSTNRKENNAMSTPLDTGSHAGAGRDVHAEFTTADYALLVSRGNWDAKPQPAPADGSARANNATAPRDRSQQVEDTEGWNTSRSDEGVETGQHAVQAIAAKAAAAQTFATASAEDAAATAPSKALFLLSAENWTPGDYTAVTPADLADLFNAHRARCQAIDGVLWRFGYHGYAGAMFAIGVSLNVLSWTTAKLSMLLTDPKNMAGAPGSLTETVTVHTRRATAMKFVAGKVLYSGYAAITTPATVVLNSVSWLTAQTAVMANDPRRLGRVVLGLLFAAIILAGIAMVAGV